MKAMRNISCNHKRERGRLIIRLAAILAAALALLMSGYSVCFAETGTWTDPETGVIWKYMDYHDEYMLMSCDNVPDNGAVTVPSAISGKNVIGMGAVGFQNNTEIKELYIPDTVTDFPGPVFYNCTSLEKVRLPEAMTGISSQMFSGCTSLSEIEIPESVVSIASDAFLGCRSIKTINIPAGVKELLNTGVPFSGCTSLESITVDQNNTAFSSIDGVLFNKKASVLIRYPQGKADKHYSLPQSVTGISEGAFQRANFETVTLSPNIAAIPDYCFSYAEKLKKLEVPSGVMSIGSHAFAGDSSLTELKLPGGLKSIGEYAFYFTSFTGLNIPDSVETISNGAFNHTKIERVKLPASLKKIEDYLFDDSAVKEVSIPDSVEVIGLNPFRYAGLLEYVYIPSSVKEIVESSYDSDVLFYGSNPGVKIYGESNSYIQTYLTINTVVVIGSFTVGTREDYEKAVTEGLGDDDDQGGGDQGGESGEGGEDGESGESGGSGENGEGGEGGQEQGNNDDRPLIKSAQTIRVTSSSFSKNTNSSPFSLGARGSSSLRYTSSDTSVANVDTKGVVTVIGPGTAVISINAAENEKYLSASENVRVSVALASPGLKVRNKKHKKAKLTWTRCNTADGYKIYVKGPKDRKFRCRLAKSARVKSVTHKGLKKGAKYKYKVIAYKKVNGRTVYSAFSRVVTVRIKK